MPTATLTDYLAADTIEEKEADQNLYLLDGTEYTVPDDVLKAGNDHRQAEERTRLPESTIHTSLTRLQEADAIATRPCFEDARATVYAAVNDPTAVES